MPNNINLRYILWALLAMALLVNYQLWVREFGASVPPRPASAAAGSSTSSAAGASLGTSVPTANAPATKGAVNAPTGNTSSGQAGNAPESAASEGAAAEGSTAASAPSGSLAAAGNAAASAAAAAPSVELVSDVLDLSVSLVGGDLVGARLLAYPQQKNEPNRPVALLDPMSPVYEVQGGLAGTRGESAPTHLVRYQTQATRMALAAGQSTLSLPLTWSDGHGLTVTKTITLHRGSYLVDVAYRIDNASGQPWSFAPYSQILRDNLPVRRSYFNPSSYAYKGPAYYDGKRFEKINYQKGGMLDMSVRDGYVAALEPYFVTAILPPADESFQYTLQSQGDEFLLKAQGPTQVIRPGGMASVSDQLFLGPKLQSTLDRIHPGLALVADYGTFTLLAKPLFQLLALVERVFGNWGWAIIFVTFLIKVVLYPLSETSYRSMAKMKTLAPRMSSLRETYKDDKEKLNHAMMDLYKREKINPLAGCLPMIIQIPVFFAWYYVLRDSVELRQAPFLLWINDLSARDPYYVLPAIMAVTMFIQTKYFSPPQGDATQQKLMLFMPVAMSVTFAFFPAGLVLYYVTNTVLGVLQQWNINRRAAAIAARARR
jgi:YidC/Oxa1 family membrane protein insertase